MATEETNDAYDEVMMRQQFDTASLDYTVWEAQKPMLQQLALVGNNGITVFDFHRMEHIFTSYNFSSLFGYDLDKIEQQGTEYFDSRIHPEDLAALRQYGVSALTFFYELPVEERRDYKSINEYRILTAGEKYIRAIEQHQVLELDAEGNVWLALSVIDISPNQESYEGIKSQLLNFKTGKLITLEADEAKTIDLSERQREILRLVKDGLLSKEISDLLSISIHTVNTHRQHILEKLGVDNSMEAVKYATRLGLIE